MTTPMLNGMIEYEEGKDWTARGPHVAGKGEAHADFRGLQADLNLFAQAAGYEGVQIDGVIGPRTVEAVQKVLAAVLAKNSLLVPAAFTTPDTPAAVAKYAARIREWLHTTAAKHLEVAPFRVYQRGTGQDWNVKGEIAYGAGAVHDEFVLLQRGLNRFADVVGFKPLETDGFIGPKTAAAVTAVYHKVVANNPALAITLFPPPDTKEEAAAFAAFIRDWLDKTATRHLIAESGA
jgi:lysozyme family protein